MIHRYHAVRRSSARVARAAHSILDAWRERRVEQEPALTERLIGSIEQAMNNSVIGGIRWTAKSLTDRSPNAQERQFGADFAGVLDMHLPEFTVRKGFLAQAKMLKESEEPSECEFKRTQARCEQMLGFSDSSFVFFYSRHGIYVVPALSILSAEPCNPRDLYHKSVAAFYQEHFECFIGDRNINAANPTILEELRERMRARNLLYLETQRIG